VNYTHGFALEKYDAVVFDLDGTLWLSGTALPGAVDFVESCRRAGATVMVATNISMSKAADVHRRLVSEQLLRDGEQVMTAGLALAASMKAAGIRRAAVLAGEGLHDEIAANGIAVHDISSQSAPGFDRQAWRTPLPNSAVVMGGWPEARLADIETAGMLAGCGLPLYVTSLEPGFPNAGGFQAGAGMMIAAAKALHRFEPIVCGKPSASYAAAVLRALGPRTSVLMVGDSLMADIGLAAAMGAESLLLLGDRPYVALSGGAAPTFVARDLRSDPTALQNM
jgi:HAD superfamily hydrolase (TIGR01450 family)